MSETYVPPHVISVLKTYQDTAPKSLHGPGLSLVHPSKAGSIVVRADTPEHHVPAHLHLHHSTGGHYGGGRGGGGGGAGSGTAVDEEQPQRLTTTIVPPVPIMTTPDPDCGIVQMTILEGKRIGCFLLGGEMRLCLPQIFNNILKMFSLEQINASIQELMIYLYNCTDQQLQEFKRARIIPETAQTCGLITRTNAERLCSALLHKQFEHRTRTALKMGGSGGHSAFRVYHRCFGKCEGIFTPELYGAGEEPACIECCKCNGMFTPQEFVCHQHEPQEIRTCHWGFNSSNWALYIHVDEGEKNREEYAKLLENIWAKERDMEPDQECDQELYYARQKVGKSDIWNSGPAYEGNIV
ncbi:AGAP007776-PA-like protein [Anopheles sinensis]|uniref:AGAP007776-PA-like protein n=1 Tax=Anopheles sinensis TaxID=74873 RepID=A0A084W7J3_ANOSI|nr:AGAP007776-PA-like protein [Anopheles sinensis]